jgi:hypothetical protein
MKGEDTVILPPLKKSPLDACRSECRIALMKSNTENKEWVVIHEVLEIVSRHGLTVYEAQKILERAMQIAGIAAGKCGKNKGDSFTEDVIPLLEESYQAAKKHLP